MTGDQAYALAKRYVNQTLGGGGAVVGKNVTIQGIEPIDGGNRITFGYTLDNGQAQTSTLDVMDGIDGQDGGTATITENASNKEDYYRLDITNKDEKFTTPNLMGIIGMEYKNKSVGTPVGEIIAVMGNEAPVNYLTCDGTVYHIADYPYLAEYFGKNFGNAGFFGGDGATTFAVPDLRGEFLRGTGVNAHYKQGSGASVGGHQDATQIQNVFMEASSKRVYAFGASGYASGQVMNQDSVIATRAGQGSYNADAQNGNASAQISIYTPRPTNTSVLWCIKCKPTYWITPTNEGISTGPPSDGDANDYEKLTNQPKINNVVLIGNLTLEQLGITKLIDDKIQQNIPIAEDGITPSIGENGNWFIGEEDTGVSAESKDGVSPTVTENADNTEDYYRLDIANGNEKFTTPNLRGIIGMEYKNKAVGTPVGEIISYMGTIAPQNYLVCDGAVYQIADYPYLAQHFADNFGTVNYFGGDGSDTFAVPDLKGEFLRGTGTNSHDNGGAGTSVGVHQPPTLIPYIHGGGSDIAVGDAGVLNAPGNADTIIPTGNNCRVIKNDSTSAGMKNRSYTARPTSTSVLYCIKYQPTYWITPTNLSEDGTA